MNGTLRSLYMTACNGTPSVIAALVNTWIPSITDLMQLLQFDYYLRWYQHSLFVVRRFRLMSVTSVDR